MGGKQRKRNLSAPLRESYMHIGRPLRNVDAIGTVTEAATMAQRWLDPRGGRMVRAHT
jgi:hypothetical protein